jgi:hypothetical protein
MVIKVVGGVRTGEDVEDLRTFLQTLEGAPPVHETVVLGCDNHGDERPTWTYVEANPREGIARRRCLQCARIVHLLDSEARWSYPPMWSCGTCHQSIAEVAAGFSMPDGSHVEWVVLGARCVECGRIDGLTDMNVSKQTLAEVINRI